MKDATAAVWEMFARTLASAAKVTPIPPLTEEQRRDRDLRNLKKKIEREARFARTKRKRSDAFYAKHVGVSPAGLEALAKGVAGKMPGGMAVIALKNKGLAVWAGADVGYQITDAGREVVRRARAMGW